MAVVKEMVTSKGVHIRFLDDDYRDKTPEELEAVKREAQRTAWRIAENVMLRRVEALKAAGMSEEDAIQEARRLAEESRKKFWAGES